MSASPSPHPASHDSISKRPTKRRALSPTSQQASAISHLLANPDRAINLPPAPSSKSLPPPPEIVANVQGSSAGAGSGEFHVYKASRRREYERLRLMDEEVRKETEAEEFKRKREEMQKKDAEKTAKARKRREKRKGNNGGGGGGAGGEAVKHKMGVEVTGTADGGRKEANGQTKETEAEEQTAAVQESSGVVILDDD